MRQIALPDLEAVVSLTPCDIPPPVPVVTTVAPVREHQSFYLSAGGCLYAVNAADGTARWCQQVKLTRTREAHLSSYGECSTAATDGVRDSASGGWRQWLDDRSLSACMVLAVYLRVQLPAMDRCAGVLRPMPRSPAGISWIGRCRW